MFPKKHGTEKKFLWNLPERIPLGWNVLTLGNWAKRFGRFALVNKVNFVFDWNSKMTNFRISLKGLYDFLVWKIAKLCYWIGFEMDACKEMCFSLVICLGKGGGTVVLWWKSFMIYFSKFVFWFLGNFWGIFIWLE